MLLTPVFPPFLHLFGFPSSHGYTDSQIVEVRGTTNILRFVQALMGISRSTGSAHMCYKVTYHTALLLEYPFTSFKTTDSKLFLIYSHFGEEYEECSLHPLGKLSWENVLDTSSLAAYPHE